MPLPEEAREKRNRFGREMDKADSSCPPQSAEHMMITLSISVLPDHRSKPDRKISFFLSVFGIDKLITRTQLERDLMLSWYEV